MNNNTPLTPEAEEQALTMILDLWKDGKKGKCLAELGEFMHDTYMKVLLSRIAELEREKKTAIELLRINFYSENSDLIWTERISEWQSYCKEHNLKIDTDGK